MKGKIIIMIFFLLATPLLSSTVNACGMIEIIKDECTMQYMSMMEYKEGEVLSNEPINDKYICDNVPEANREACNQCYTRQNQEMLREYQEIEKLREYEKHKREQFERFLMNGGIIYAALVIGILIFDIIYTLKFVKTPKKSRKKEHFKLIIILVVSSIILIVLILTDMVLYLGLQLMC